MNSPCRNKSVLRQKEKGLCNGCGASESRITYQDEYGFRWCPWCAYKAGYITEAELRRDAQEEMLMRVGMKGDSEEATPFSKQSRDLRKDFLATLFKQRKIHHG